MRIDYGTGQSKSHALLATSYLEGAIEAAVRNSLIDVGMQGLRVLSGVCQQFFIAGNLIDGTGSLSKIAIFGMVGAVSEKHRPLTLTSMEQLRNLLLVLLRVKEQDIGFATRELRKSVNQVATSFLQLPDTALVSTHSTYLAPFFSSTSVNSFRDQLTNLVNALQDTEDKEAAERIAEHLEIWADGLALEQRELLLLSIEKRSNFTFDMIHWITGITELLIGVSRAPHTRDYARDELKNHALWLFSTLTFIPTDKDTVCFVENCSFQSEVFEAALKAQRDDWPEGYDAAWKLSMRWALEGGQHQTGWATMENWLMALCALALKGNINRAEQLKAELSKRLQDDNVPSQEMRDRAARGLRETAEYVCEREFELDLVKRILANNNREQTHALLRGVADLLSPEAAD